MDVSTGGIRALSLTFSITVYSLTTVLCAFMAGLGLGAGLSGRIAATFASSTTRVLWMAPSGWSGLEREAKQR